MLTRTVLTNDILDDEQASLDRAIEELQAHKHEWARLAIPAKIEMLLQVRQNLKQEAQRWVDTAIKARGMEGDPIALGEEWYETWTTAVAINAYVDTLRMLAASRTLMPGQVWTRPDGQVAARVFPANLWDWLLFNGITVEVRMQRGITAENLAQHMAAFYKEKNPREGVALILGAGNVNSIAPLDVLYRLIALGQVVLLKASPVNEYLAPILERVLAPLIECGYLRIVCGGAEVGRYLTRHRGIDEIHITGSARTYHAIVYGEGEAGEARRQHHEPLLRKPITSELGGVSPVIIVPGPWSQADLRFHAENIWSMKLWNNGFTCIAAQMLILPDNWDRREDFLDTLRAVMRAIPPRRAYYPGAAERRQAAIAGRNDVELTSGDVPRTLITSIDPGRPAEFCLREECFGPILAVTCLPGRTPAEFLANAAQFCNEKLTGTLGANIIVHPKTANLLGSALDNALDDLRYGTIGVNVWCGLGYRLLQAPWGAYQSMTEEDGHSGIGVVHNSLLFDKPEKTIVRGSFYRFPNSWLHGDPCLMPRPPWFLMNKTMAAIAPRIAKAAFEPGYRHLPGILFYALRGSRHGVRGCCVGIVAKEKCLQVEAIGRA